MQWSVLEHQPEHTRRTGPVDNKIVCTYEYQHATYPPFSHIAHGAKEFSSAPAVNDPLLLSKAQKKRVALGWLGLFTGRFPAKLWGRSKETFGNESFTSKSVRGGKGRTD